MPPVPTSERIWSASAEEFDLRGRRQFLDSAPLCPSGNSRAHFRPETLIRRPDVTPAAIHSGQPARVAGRSLAWLQSGFTRSGDAPLRTGMHVAMAHSATRSSVRRRLLSNFSRMSACTRCRHLGATMTFQCCRRRCPLSGSGKADLYGRRACGAFLTFGTSSLRQLHRTGPKRAMNSPATVGERFGGTTLGSLFLR